MSIGLKSVGRGAILGFIFNVLVYFCSELQKSFSRSPELFDLVSQVIITLSEVANLSVELLKLSLVLLLLLSELFNTSVCKRAECKGAKNKEEGASFGVHESHILSN